jgi:hypothetical protein
VSVSRAPYPGLSLVSSMDEDDARRVVKEGRQLCNMEAANRET